MESINPNLCGRCGSEINNTQYSSLKDGVLLCPSCAISEDNQREIHILGYFGNLEERIAYYLYQCDYYNPDFDLQVYDFTEENIEKIRRSLIDLNCLNALISLFEDLKSEDETSEIDIACYNQIIRELSVLLKKAKKVSVIKSNGLFSPQAFLECVIGKCYSFTVKIPIVEQIKNILKENGFQTDNYSLTETAAALKTGKFFVLVDCTDVGENSEPKHEYRWFCVPENIKKIE